MLNPKQPILWAVDALYGQDIDSKQSNKPQSVDLIQAWTADEELPVEPVFICNDIRVEESWDHPDGRKNLKKIDDLIETGTFGAPRIVKNVEPPFTQRKLVDGLLRYAQERQAQLIVVHASNKPAHVRMLLGSFTENLIHSSSIPVLVLGAESKTPKSIKRILFATDFSRESFDAYTEVLDKARSLEAEVFVFNQGESWFGVPEGLTEQTKKAEVAQRWGEEAQAHRVKAEITISDTGQSKADAILKAAEERKVDLIALVSRTGNIGRLMLGSTTANVVRRSDLPVLILYPRS